ncbi:unnamed protein product [marine sediment metagenome]|uniref:Uncharacterized protein n=1 Tax=marine sediment metagenome TaxID=412755 RepID=X1B7R1_9ZZZZ
MEYECQIISFDRLAIGAIGIQEPLCNDCQTPDCTNPIEEQIVSVLGVPKKMRLWVVNNVIRQVMICKGYIGTADVVGHSKRNAKTEGS